MKKNRIYVDLHVIQTVPPSCVNRDDTGSPKTAVYGGTTRARVSSQSWKHAMRLMFPELLSTEELGSRTKKVKDLIKEKILLENPDADAEKLAKTVMNSAGFKADQKKDMTLKALFFISTSQVNALAKVALDGNAGDKEIVKEALKESPSIDMALFGRMVADDPSLNYDASAQVAHSISTHTVHNEFDYFTAVDDCAPEDNAGAAHLGTVEYNSSTLYRYATVNVQELASHVGSQLEDALRAFIEAFICSMPTGKQNTFANKTLPDLVYVTVRNDQPINLVGAFEAPVKGRNGYVASSVEALTAHAAQLYDDYQCEPVKAFYCGKGSDVMGEKVSLPMLLENVISSVNGLLEG